jgi:hypothetical protein
MRTRWLLEEVHDFPQRKRLLLLHMIREEKRKTQLDGKLAVAARERCEDVHPRTVVRLSSRASEASSQAWNGNSNPFSHGIASRSFATETVRQEVWCQAFRGRVQFKTLSRGR